MMEAELREEIEHLDSCIARRKKFIHVMSDEKYVERSALPQEFLRLLDSGQTSKAKASLSFRCSTLGAALLTERRRPYEYASRDRNPEVKAAAKKLKLLIERRKGLVDRLEGLLEQGTPTELEPLIGDRFRNSLTLAVAMVIEIREPIQGKRRSGVKQWVLENERIGTKFTLSRYEIERFGWEKIESIAGIENESEA